MAASSRAGMARGADLKIIRATARADRAVRAIRTMEAAAEPQTMRGRGQPKALAGARALAAAPAESARLEAMAAVRRTAMAGPAMRGAAGDRAR